jgi:phospholipid/cholesterol/gamma-HCH transport system ATP-binding protein
MSEEKDEATMAEEQAHIEAGHHGGGVEELEGVPPQITATPGMPERKAVKRRQERVRRNLHLLPKDAQEAILESFRNEGVDVDSRQEYDRDSGRHRGDEEETATMQAQRQ